MNHAALKPFAQNARKELLKQVELRLDYVLRTDSTELRQQEPQVKALREALSKEGKVALVERVAYTWFNRLTALRFMDANGYHPFGCRVITGASAQETLPEILQQARAGVLDTELRGHLDSQATFDGILAGTIPTPSKEGSTYRMLLVAVCRYYHQLMPFMFEKLGDATELLLPEDILTEHSVVHPFRIEVTDELCSDVEMLGWLYQYYISEKKADVDAKVKQGKTVQVDEIPAKTQLFTPHWIVRYLVENSLGRLWLLNRPSSKLREKMPYYIAASSEASGEGGRGEAETDFLKISKPEEIRLVDPAAGSAHMLTYAFDLLYSIYEEEGYDAPEIPSLILQHNLHGLEICERAAALAAFALCMKARSRDNRFFRRLEKGDAPRPQIIELQNVRFAQGELRDYIDALGLGDLFNQPLLKLLHQFEDAKNFGSLIQPSIDEQTIIDVRRAIETKDLGGLLFLRETHLNVLRVLEQAKALTQRYHVVVANPPYLKGGFMTKILKRFSEQEYPQSKANLYAMFLERCLTLVATDGLLAMVNLHGWMFTVRYEKLRKQLLVGTTFITMAHLGANGFDEISGEVVQTTAFALKNTKYNGYYTTDFFRLVDGENEAEKNLALQARKNRYTITCKVFSEIEGSPMAYWLSESARSAFNRFHPIEYYAEIRAGLQSGDNQTFLRYWHEVQFSSVGLGFSSRSNAAKSGKRWFPHNKGGLYRRWYGNGEYLLNWEDDGKAIKSRKEADLEAGRITPNNAKCWNQDYYFLNGFSWTALSTGNISARDNGYGYLFDTKGQTVFPHDANNRAAVLGFLNSSISTFFLEALSPTLDFNGGTVGKLPIPLEISKNARFVDSVQECVSIAHADWDNFETSWDFRDLPLLRTNLKGLTVEASWQNWEAQSNATIRRMQELETENNRLFIAAYSLDGELQPDVPEEQITLARAEAKKDMAAFISYAVGCMMGRYSLDHPGLILANEGDTVQNYLTKVGKAKEQLTFVPDQDGIIPVLDGEWFADDIVTRSRDFLRATFGEDSLTENVRFIEASLGKELRKYFTNQFYKDHLQTYKKRPIYWMVSSPEGSFQALIYLHRYTRDTINLLLTNYVREFVHKLEGKHQQLTSVTLDESARPGEKTKAAKELGKISKMIKEIKDWEREVVLPLAQQRIELDLDDGVKVNYLKFPGLLVPIPGLEKKEED